MKTSNKLSCSIIYERIKLSKKYFSLFKSWFLSKWQINLFQHYWDEVTYIVPCNDLKEMINTHIQKRNVVCVIQLLQRINIKTKFYMKSYNSTQGNMFQTLTLINYIHSKELYKNMKVMLINNLYLKLGLINGTTSIIHKLW